MTEQVDRKADSTRLHILRAAAHEFAHRPYSSVNLDDILARAEMTKGAMYSHFRSKNALAAAIIEQAALVGQAGTEDVSARGLSGLETLVDAIYLVAAEDLADDTVRAGFNLLDAVGQADGLLARVMGLWVADFAAIAKRAIRDGDLQAGQEPEDIGRLMVSMYLGIRQINEVDDASRLYPDLQTTLLLILPGITAPDRIGYFAQFVRRRTGLAMRRSRRSADR